MQTQTWSRDAHVDDPRAGRRRMMSGYCLEFFVRVFGRDLAEDGFVVRRRLRWHWLQRGGFGLPLGKLRIGVAGGPRSGVYIAAV